MKFVVKDPLLGLVKEEKLHAREGQEGATKKNFTLYAVLASLTARRASRNVQGGRSCHG